MGVMGVKPVSAMFMQAALTTGSLGNVQLHPWVTPHLHLPQCLQSHCGSRLAVVTHKCNTGMLTV